MANATRVAGGARSDGLSQVTADQKTILGNGTRENPLRLRTDLFDGTFQASFRGGSIEPAPGMPVFVSSVVVLGGITTVQPTDVSPVPPSQLDSFAFASVYGLVKSVDESGIVRIAPGGLLQLSTAEWDAVTGQVGGLTPGSTYFAIRGAQRIFLNAAPDPTPGVFTTRVGVALNAATMLIAPSAPVRNLEDQILFATFASQEFPLGSAVFVSSDGRVDAAASDASAAASRAIGIVAAFDASGRPIVQISGVVDLVSFEWDAVTDTRPGMKAGVAYFLATSARPGRLTGTPPAVGSKVQVGVGFSSSQLVLSPPLPSPAP